MLSEEEMDLIDSLGALAGRLEKTLSLIKTEEATKNSMIMPLIQLLGYNVFDPQEVTPEYVSDIGTKKGEKVDYAILKDGQPIMLFECKKYGDELKINHAGQLFRYFHVTSVRFGVLTNGIEYKFFSDLEQPNKMDEKPFFEFNLLNYKERDVNELKKFAKAAFDLDSILNNANDLKYTRLVKNKLNSWLLEPSEEFVRLVALDIVESKRFTANIKEQFTSITKLAFEQLISEKINERLKGAMESNIQEKVVAKENNDSNEINVEETSNSGIVTTREEYDAYYMVRAIVRGALSVERVFIRDQQSYCSIIADDNNRKPLCRLRFNSKKTLSIGIFNQDKVEEIFKIDSLDDIYKYADKLIAVAKHYSDSDAQV
jgi:predicted type IV restriction endonuclease